MVLTFCILLTNLSCNNYSWSCFNTLISDSNSILILLMPYLSIAILSRPIPNAKPEYSLVSIPQPSRTLLLTTPAPRTSIQPVPLQSLHPHPPHWKQLTSTSTDG